MKRIFLITTALVITLSGFAGTYYSTDLRTLPDGSFPWSDDGYRTVNSMAVDSSGSLYISMYASDNRPLSGNYFITKSSYVGTWTLAAGIRADDLEISQNGEVYTLNSLTGDIGRLSETGLYSHVATVAGTRSILVDKSDILYGATGNSLMRITSPLAAPTMIASLSSDIMDQGLAIDSRGNIFAKTLTGVERITPEGVISMIFSWEHLAALTGRNFIGPLTGIAIDENDNVLVNYESSFLFRRQMYTIGFSQTAGFFADTFRGIDGGLFSYTPLEPVPVILVPEPTTSVLIFLSLGCCFYLQARKPDLYRNPQPRRGNSTGINV